MKIVLNKCYGAFSVSEEAMRALRLNSPMEADRYDPKLIALVEINAKFTSGERAFLTVVEIPEEATDHYVVSYDGFETVLYVIYGKIHKA